MLKPLDHTHTHTNTHTHKDGRISLWNRPITTQKTTNPRDEHPCFERDSKLRYLQHSGRTPYSNRDRWLFIYCILDTFFLKTRKVLNYLHIYFFLNFYLLCCKMSWNVSINTVGNSEHDRNSSHYVSYLAHCVNLDVQVTQNIGSSVYSSV